MYAIIKTGGKQYRVAPGEYVDIELLDADIGETVEFKEVLLVAKEGSIQVGSPHVNGCTVMGELVSYSDGPKIHSMKYRKRKRSYKKWGHRQLYTRVKIQDIQLATA